MKRRLGLGVDEDVTTTIGSDVATAMAWVDTESRVKTKISPERAKRGSETIGLWLDESFAGVRNARGAIETFAREARRSGHSLTSTKSIKLESPKRQDPTT